MGDEESFKLLLFFIGNGGGPRLISRWIMLAQFWAESQQKAKKRAWQVDFSCSEQCGRQKKHGFYFDVDYQRLLLLNGLP